MILSKEKAYEKLINTKVYVETLEKREKIIKKLEIIGFSWTKNQAFVKPDTPYLFTNFDGRIFAETSLKNFCMNVNKEVKADDILNIEIKIVTVFDSELYSAAEKYATVNFPPEESSVKHDIAYHAFMDGSKWEQNRKLNLEL